MIRLAANVSFLFGEMPFLDRFQAARDAGFDAVEFTFVYDLPPGAIAQRCRSAGVRPVLMNAPAGNIAMGESGIAALPGREAELRETFGEALHYARLIGVPRIHLLAGNAREGSDPVAIRHTFVANLRWASEQAAVDGITVTIEPLNAQDRPHYVLRTSEQACAILEEVARPNVRLQLDLYHHQITEGHPNVRLAMLMPWVDHVQIAGVPGRHEPEGGLLDTRMVLNALDRLGYCGHVGCEYLPRGGTLAGLGWAKPYLRRMAAVA